VWCCGSKPPKIEKPFYPPQHQRDAELVDVLPAKTQSQKFSGERKVMACRKEGKNN
jgi:hypothetical protein